MRKLLTLLCCTAIMNAQADDFVEWVGPNSGVNWSSGTIQAEGAGVGPDNTPPSVARMLACRAAVVDAQRNLVESIHGVRVEGTTVVENMMVESDIIKTSVDGVLKGAQVVNRQPQDDGSCFVEVSAPLGGKFASNVYDQVYDDAGEISGSPTMTETLMVMVDASIEWLIPSAMAAQTQPWQASIDSLSARLSALEELLTTHPGVVAQKDSTPTGLVIDARGSNFIPSMSPEIRKIRAGVIYPNSQHRVTRRDRGQLVSLFTRDLNTARRHPVVGEKPVVLKALRTFGDTRTSIVLGDESSERLEKLVSDGLLNDAGVIIVL